MKIKLFHVDAFTTEYFKGNSAGVVILENTDIEDHRKQNIAAELKHSETAFVVIADGKISLRWFTPTTEVDLCGHATLAAAHVLYEKAYFPGEESIHFETRSGQLVIEKSSGRISMNFPLIRMEDTLDIPTYAEILGVKLNSMAKNGKRHLAEFANANDLREFEPDFDRLKRTGIGALMITSTSDNPKYDFISRFFAPGFGINEDPVTGSAHCYLAPYWEEKLGKRKFLAFQASKRTGEIECEVLENSRVRLCGKAVTLFETELNFA